MTYLDALESELATAGIPARRRARILAEFSDHLAQDAGAELGAPRELARQFADEIGTRLARRTAYVAFIALAVVAVFLAILFATGGRQHGWVGYGRYFESLAPRWWYGPLQIVCLIAAQIALASGVLAALRAYRLRREVALTSADAAIINRRTALALIAGAVTMMDLPLTRVGERSLAWPRNGIWWPAERYGGLAAIVLLLSLLPAVMAAARLRPQRSGAPGDLLTDLGAEHPRLAPRHAAWVLCSLILVVMTAIGVRGHDTYDGVLRGLFDAGACMAGFSILGRYLGLESGRESAR